MPSRHLIKLALAGTAVAALASPGTAFAAGRPAAHVHAKPASHGKPVTHGKPVDHLAGPRQGTLRALAAQTAAVNRVAAGEAASTVLSDSDKSNAATFNANALSALAADVTAANSATSIRALVSTQQSGQRTSEAVRLVAQSLTMAAGDSATIAQLSGGVATAQSQEAALPAGTDTSSVDAPLADLAAQLTAAQDDLSTATAAVLGVPAAPDATALRTARTTAGPALETAGSALQAAAADLASAQAALAALSATPAP